VLRLLAKGIDRRSLDKGLGVAAELAPPAIVRDLLIAGADPEAWDFFGFTALMRAVGRKHARVVKVLLAHGAEVNAKSDAYVGDAPGMLRTPLMLAAMSGDLRTVLLLLRAGADPTATERDGYTALHWAAFYAAPSPVLEALLDRGAKIDPVDVYGRTPLILAAWQGALAAAETLVARGAQMNLRDHESFSAWMWAVKWGHSAVAQLLAECGAVIETDEVQVVPGEIRRFLTAHPR